MTTMKPCRIRAKLKTSVKIGKHPVSLDGLLWHCLYLHTCDQARASDLLSDYLSEAHGFFKSSAMRFGVQKDSQLYATHRITVGAMRPATDLHTSWFHPNGYKGKYSHLTVVGGPRRNRFTHHKTYQTEQLVWDLVGDAERICKLLNFYITCVGMEANRGFGMIDGFIWEELDEDLSWFDDQGRPARLLSPDVYEALGVPIPENAEVILAKAKPPYRDEDLIDCIVPQRIRTVAVSTI